ncbi:permease [Opitutaceae bacterium EW11]|nr:permease [Opitutaceae bacterium EW11]
MYSDLKFAYRQIARSPVFAFVTVLTLALGIGLNTSMFSIVNAVLLRPLPYPGGERLVRISASTPRAQSLAMTAPEATAFRQSIDQAGFESWGLFGWWGANFVESGRPAELLVSIRGSAGFLSTLGVQPLLGRWFTAEEDSRNDPVALISEELWRRTYAGDPGIVGRAIHVDGEALTVVGVLPRKIAAPAVFGVVDLWRPLRITETELTETRNRWLYVVAKLAPGASLPRTNATLATLAARIPRDGTNASDRTGMVATPLHVSNTDDAVRSITWLSLALTALVLLIACANLANLQLARAASRSRETLVRAALGASREQLIRPMLLESLLLSLVGGTAALGVAAGATNWVARHVVFNNAPPGYDIPLDGRTLLFALAASVITGLAIGVLPGYLAGRAELASGLRDAGRGNTSGPRQQRLRRGLVIAEYAVALVLLTGAGLILGGLKGFLQRDAGWRADGLAYGYVALQTPRYNADAETIRFYEQLQERLGNLPGVKGVAFGWDVPITPAHDPRAFRVENRAQVQAGDAPLAFFTGVLPRYFEGLGIRLAAGRDFTRRDDANAPRVAIVNEALARAFWPGEDPIGKRIGNVDPSNPRWMEVVGVASDTRFIGHLATPATRYQVYIPFAQEVWRWGAVAVRTSAAPESLVDSIRRTVTDLDPEIPVWEARTVAQEVDRRLANTQLLAQLLGSVAALGLLLSALGIHALVSHDVTQRTSEIGVRMALGADLASIYRLILGSGMRLAGLGGAVGLVGAFFLSVGLRRAVPEIPGLQTSWIAATIGLLAATALAAIWLPVRRAARIDPIVALRGE